MSLHLRTDDLRRAIALVLTLVSCTAARSPVAPHTAESVVRELYAYVIRHQPIGIPQGDTRNALRPLMSERLRNRLETAAACEADYFRQYTKSDEKPIFGWLEHGLFSGGSERAIPAEMTIVSTKPATAGRQQVTIRLTYRDTFETYGRPPDPANTFHWEVDVLVDCPGRSCVVDDVVEIDDTGKRLRPLSEGFESCDGRRWVGYPAEP